jgi:hypothetical protein
MNKTREVIREVLHITVDSKVNSGEIDWAINELERGNLFDFTINLSLVPNDLVWIHMINDTYDEDIRKKILKIKESK